MCHGAHQIPKQGTTLVFFLSFGGKVVKSLDPLVSSGRVDP